MSTANDPWGRVADDGTVFVRTAGGERVVGSWQAGSPDEALAFYRRKYTSLETEVALLEQRLSGTDLSPGAARATIDRLLEAVATANAIGDLDSLQSRLEALTGQVEGRREEVRAAREHARVEAKAVKEQIVAEAEQIAAEATHWKISGERMRQLLEEWKAAPRADRAVETALWKRLSAARNAFAKRRKAYFAGLEEERDQAKSSKEKLVVEAEALATSTDWGPTAAAYRDLMRSWKAAGRAGRADEEDLWTRFKAAQDHFFAARSEVYSAKENELREHAEVKAALLEEANQLLPAATCGPRGPRCAPSRSAGSRPGRCHGRRTTGWSRACAGSRTRSARPRTRSGAGPTPRRWPGPRAPWSRSGRPSPAWRSSWPRRSSAATPGPRSRPPRPSRPAVPGWRKPSARWPNSPAEASPRILNGQHPVRARRLARGPD